MRFATLGSGSRGNATLIESGSSRLLVDNGFSVRELESRLGVLGVEPDSIEALLLTHEHGDHSRGVAALASRYGITVWTTPGTWRALGAPEAPFSDSSRATTVPSVSAICESCPIRSPTMPGSRPSSSSSAPAVAWGC